MFKNSFLLIEEISEITKEYKEGYKNHHIPNCTDVTNFSPSFSLFLLGLARIPTVNLKESLLGPVGRLKSSPHCKKINSEES